MEIVKDGTVSIDTIYRLYDGEDFITKAYCFLYEAREANCTVVFENEGLTILPNEESVINALLITAYGVYPLIAETASKGMEMAKLN